MTNTGSWWEEVETPKKASRVCDLDDWFEKPIMEDKHDTKDPCCLMLMNCYSGVAPYEHRNKEFCDDAVHQCVQQHNSGEAQQVASVLTSDKLSCGTFRTVRSRCNCGARCGTVDLIERAHLTFAAARVESDEKLSKTKPGFFDSRSYYDDHFHEQNHYVPAAKEKLAYSIKFGRRKNRKGKKKEPK